MADAIGSIGRGITALTRARTAAAELAELAIPRFGRGPAKALRGEAVEQATLALHELGSAISTSHRTHLESAATALRQARMGERHVHPAARELAASLAQVWLRPGDVATRAAQDARTHPAFTDPDQLRATLRALLDATPEDPHQQTHRIAQLAAFTSADSPALRTIAPALPEHWAYTRETLTLPALHMYRSPGQTELAEHVTRRILAGDFATDAARRAALHRALEYGDDATPANAIAVSALVGADPTLPWAADLHTFMPRPDLTPKQWSALDAIRLTVTGAADDAARIEREVDELLAAYRRTLDPTPATLGRLHARLGALGAAERLDLPNARFVDLLLSAEPLDRRARDIALTSWADVRHWHHADDAQVARDFIELAGQWPDSAERLGRQLYELGLFERLGLQDSASPHVLAERLRTRSEAGLDDLARYTLQLDGALATPAASQERLRALVERGTSLDLFDRARVRALLRDTDAASRLDLPLTIEGELDAVVTPHTHDHMMRYLRLWQQRVQGRLLTPQDAAERTRELLAAPTTDPEALHALGTAAVDAGGAEALGLPLQLAGVAPAAASFRGSDGLAASGTLLRYAHTWRSILRGEGSNPQLLRSAIDRIATTAPASVDPLDSVLVLTHGFDLPGAPLRELRHLYRPEHAAQWADHTHAGTRLVQRWPVQVQLVLDDVPTAQRLDAIQQLVATGDLQTSQYADLLAHLAAIDERTLADAGIDAPLVRELLGTRLDGSDHMANGVRARLLLHHALGGAPEVAPADRIAAIRARLVLDPSDAEGLGRSYVELLDHGLLARALPADAGPDIARLQRALSARWPDRNTLREATAAIETQLQRVERLDQARAAGVQAPDHAALRAAIAQLRAREHASRQQAVLDVLLHGYDLPGAPLGALPNHQRLLVQLHRMERPSREVWERLVEQLDLATQPLGRDERITRLRELATIEAPTSQQLRTAHAHLGALKSGTEAIGPNAWEPALGLLNEQMPAIVEDDVRGLLAWMHLRRAFDQDTAPLQLAVFSRIASSAEEAARLGPQLDPDAAMRGLLAGMGRGSHVRPDSHELLVALERHARSTLRPSTAQRAAILAAAEPGDLPALRRWLADARELLHDPVADALGELRERMLDRIDVNMRRLSGGAPIGEVRGYGMHPDYAEIGRVRSTIQLLARMLDEPAAPAAPAAELLSW